MLDKTEGIVLKQFKYNDKSRIVNIFTKDLGKRSFLVFGGNSKKSQNKIKILQPFFNVGIVFYNKNNAGLLKIKEVSLKKSYLNITSSVKKMTIALFLSEVLQNSINQYLVDARLYDFITNAMEFFDLTDEKTENFHLFFLVKLTKFLGFYPLNNFSAENKFFNIKEGKFVPSYTYDFSLINNESKIFSKILQTDLADFNTLNISSVDRKSLLEKILRYYSFHIENFGEIKSLGVLKKVFE